MIDLHVDTTTLRRTGFGGVLCVMYFELDDGPCPQREWDDFALPVLTWWCDAAARMARGFSRRETLSFMDGPWTLQLDIDPEGTVNATGLHNRTVRGRGSGSVDELARSILAGASRVARAIRREGWEASELEGLEDRIEALRLALAGS